LCTILFLVVIPSKACWRSRVISPPWANATAASFDPIDLEFFSFPRQSFIGSSASANLMSICSTSAASSAVTASISACLRSPRLNVSWARTSKEAARDGSYPSRTSASSSCQSSLLRYSAPNLSLTLHDCRVICSCRPSSGLNGCQLFPSSRLHLRPNSP